MLQLTEEMRSRLAELYLTAHHLLRDMQELGRQREAVLREIDEVIRGAGYDPAEVEPVFDGYRFRGLRRCQEETAYGSRASGDPAGS